MAEAIASPADLARPEVRALTAYHLDQTPCRFKLDQNEVPWDLPRTLKERVLAELLDRDWARYPDFHGDALRRDLAELHGHPFEGVLVGNGSNELLSVALETLTPPGGSVVTALPTFSLYRVFALRVGAATCFVPPRPDFALPIEELEGEMARGPHRPLVLCTPNNPTGAAATPEQVERLLAASEGPVLLDNAYGEFCRHDYRPLLTDHPRLLLFRTFSKAWSLAGLRLGYVLAHPDLVAEMIKLKLPYNLGHGAAAAGRAALAAAPVLERRVRVILGRRERYRALLQRHGFTVPPSEANFLLACAPETVSVDRVRQGLQDRGILVRDVSHYPGLDGCMRVSVGDGRAERALDAALTEILATSTNDEETHP